MWFLGAAAAFLGAFVSSLANLALDGRARRIRVLAPAVAFALSVIPVIVFSYELEVLGWYLE